MAGGLGHPLADDVIVILDELREDISELGLVGVNDSIVEFDVAVGAKTDNVSRMIRPVVWGAERFDMVCLGVR